MDMATEPKPLVEGPRSSPCHRTFSALIAKHRIHTPSNTPPPRASCAPRLEDCQLAGGMKLSKWRELVGISRTVAWRLRKSGRLAVIVRYGEAYVTAETIAGFFTNDGSTIREPKFLHGRGHGP